MNRAASKSHQHLQPWLELANLLRPPPSRDELDKSPNVLGVSLLVSRWEAQNHHEAPEDFMRRFERSRLAPAPALSTVMDSASRNQPGYARHFLEFVGDVARTLRSIADAASADIPEAMRDIPLMRLYEIPRLARCEVWIRNGVVATNWFDPFMEFLAALQGVEAKRVRQCPVCQRFFVALRKDQKACSKRCNVVRRVRDWRANQGRYEYRRKLSGAGLDAGKTKTRKLKTTR